jgi:hypothetical protein
MKELQAISREMVDPHCKWHWSSPPSHCHSSIFCCLLEGIIGIVWPLSQHEERLLQITVDKRQQCDGREDNVRHEGLNDISEAVGDSGIMESDEYTTEAQRRLLHETESDLENIVTSDKVCVGPQLLRAFRDRKWPHPRSHPRYF